MTIQGEKDLEMLKAIGKIVALAREQMLQAIRPGITTLELDLIGKQVLDQFGARSAPKMEYNFPGFTCISINDEVAHGIPGSRVIKGGDLVNVDVSAELDGYYADTGATLMVDSGLDRLDQKRELCRCSEQSLYKAIEKAKAGSKINQLGKAMHHEAKNNGFNMIRNLCGHGIGKKLHEEPHSVLTYYWPWDNRILNKGLVLAVETFVCTGAQYVVQENDGWTLKTPDGSVAAQFEHTIVITDNEPIILTAV